MSPLAKTDYAELWKRFRYYFFAPFWVSLILGMVSLLSTSYWQNVIVAGITGQLALTLIKLFLYFSFFQLGIAAVIRQVPYIGRFFLWSGSRLAEVTFDYTSAALGVFVGIMPAVLIELGIAKGGAVIFPLILTMTALEFGLWACTNLAAGNFAEFHKQPIITGLLGIGLITIATTSFLDERWYETQYDDAKNGNIQRPKESLREP